MISFILQGSRVAEHAETLQTGIHDSIERWLGISEAVQGKVLYSLLVLLILFVLQKLATYLINRFREDVESKYYLRNAVSYVLIAIGFLLLTSIWLGGLSSLATYLGIVSAGLAIALSAPIVNLAGWLFLLIARPFSVGDRISIGNLSGDVISTGMQQFVLNELAPIDQGGQSTGRIIHVPNGKLFSESQKNHTQGIGFVWNEIPVLITFESDWKKCKGILTEIIETYSSAITPQAKKAVRRASDKYLLKYGNLTPIVYTDVKDSGVLLTIRYLCNPYQKRISQEIIWEDILKAFAEHKSLDLAYPTLRHIQSKG